MDARSRFARFHQDCYAASMFEGLSKREVVGWIICLVLAVALTLLGTAYLATSFMTADVSGALQHPDRAKSAAP